MFPQYCNYRFIFKILTLALLVFSIGAAEETTLLTNPGFEDNETGWIFKRGGKVTGKTPHSGSLALELSPETLSGWNYHLVEQRVPVSPGEIYILSGWVKTEGIQGEIQFQYRLEGAENGNRGTGAVCKYPETQNCYFSGTVDYQLVQKSIKVPEDVKFIVLKLTVPSNEPGTVYFDDLDLRKRILAGPEFYVDPIFGSDFNPGSEEDPFLTIAEALNHLEPGDTLYLRGPENYYYPYSKFNIHGTEQDPITICAYPGETVIFDPGYPEFRESPQSAWEPAIDPEAHPDEWVSVNTYPESNARFGQFLGLNVRLIAYSRIEDFRATNQSYVKVPLSDPRPSGGPLVNDPLKKTPWTYFGPGLYWHPETGRIHIRLSHTHFNAAGITDYRGTTDPRDLELAITGEPQLAGEIGGTHLVFKDLTFQNGGEATLNMGHSENVILDHVTVYGSRLGVRIGGAPGLKLLHCLLDGGVAPWTTRVDLKEEYEFLNPNEPNGKGNNKTGKNTNDMLLVGGNNHDLEIAYSEFRNSHDAAQLFGRNIRFHHNLLQNINDEGLIVGCPNSNEEVFDCSEYTKNVHIFQNLIRQTLNPISFALKGATGDVYIYRNIIDQRVPTAGRRILPPDTLAPEIWRWGLDFKMNLPIGPFYVYHNTFVVSHNYIRTLSHCFSNTDVNDPHERFFFNNQHLSINSALPFSWIPDPSFPAESDGNLWFKLDQDDQSPAFRYKIDNKTRYFDSLEELQANKELFPGWEANSLVSDPRARRLSKVLFDYASTHPNTDYRPAADSMAIDASIDLSLYDLPDINVDDVGPPDIGALAFESEPFAVGIDAQIEIPAPGLPSANAGESVIVNDIDRNGYEEVMLNGAESDDLDGSIESYEWVVAGTNRYVPFEADITTPPNTVAMRLSLRIQGQETGSAYFDELGIYDLNGENLLENADIESGSENWQFVRGGAITTDRAYRGMQALWLEGTQAYRLVEQTVVVTPGQSYRVSGWLRTDDLSKAAEVSVRFLNANDGKVGSARIVEIAGTTLAGNGPTPKIVFNEGRHLVELKVTDNDGNTDVDRVLIEFPHENLSEGSLLGNPGFERGKESWKFIRGGGIEKLNPQSGETNLIMAPYTRWATDDRQWVQQKVAVTPGKTYVLSGWVKTQDIAGNFEFQYQFQGFDGENEGFVTFEQVSGTTDYTYYETQVTVPEEVEFLVVILKLPALECCSEPDPGTVYIDDLRLIERNQLDNPNFEQGDKSWKLIRGGSVQNLNPHTGLASLTMTPKTKWSNYNYQLAQQRVEVTPGETYLLSGWLKTEDIAGEALIQFQRQSSSGRNMGFKTIGQASGTTDYTYHEYLETVEEGVGFLVMVLKLSALGDGSADPGSVFFDTLAIQED